MSTPEGKVKQFIDKFMKENYPDASKYAPPGGPFGKAGFPDRMWWIYATKDFGVTVAIEAKAIGNDEPTEIQLKTLKALANRGCICAVVVGKDLDHLRRIRDEVDRRVRLAVEKFGTSAIRESEGDDEVSASE